MAGRGVRGRERWCGAAGAWVGADHVACGRLGEGAFCLPRQGGGERSGFRRFGVGCSGRLGDALAGFPAGVGMRRSAGKRCAALSLWCWVGR